MTKSDIKFRYFALTLTLGVAAYVVYRAVHLTLVHDESITYDIVKQHTGSVWAKTANNHWLNTALMGFCSRNLGHAEWLLRLPNTLAFGLYAPFGCLIFEKLDAKILKYAGFTILLINPFLLDFFSLARGYGLAIGLMVASIYFLIKLFEDSKNVFFQAAFGILSALTILSNFTMLIFYAAAMLIWAAVCFKNQGIRFLLRPVILLVIFAHAYVLKEILNFIFYLKKVGGLYAGGTSFTKDVIGSNLTTFFYNANSPFLNSLQFVIFGVIFLFGFLLFYFIFNLSKSVKIKEEQILFPLLCLCVVIPIVQFYAIGILFPTERGAVFYYPLWIFALFSVLDLSKKAYFQNLFALPLSIFTLFNFSKTANLNHTFTWAYEVHTRDFLDELKTLHANKMLPEPVRLGVHWKYQPSLEYYYRSQLGFEWIAPVERETLGKKAFDVYYIEENELPLVRQLDPETVILKQFSENKSLILIKKK